MNYKKAITLFISALTLSAGTSAMTANAADGILYDQHDAKWSEIKFDKYSTTASTMELSGCGIFSFCNAIYALNGTIADAYEVADWAVDIGGYRPGAGGTYRYPFYQQVEEAFGERYGFRVDGYYTGAVTDEALIEHLKNGGVAVVNVPWHFMAITGYNEEDETYHVLECAVDMEKRGLEADSWATAETMSTGRTEVGWYVLLSDTGTSDRTIPESLDINSDGFVNSLDTSLISARYHENETGDLTSAFGMNDDIRNAIDEFADIDHDGVITQRDSRVLLNWIKDMNTTGDINCDNIIDARDASSILSYYAYVSAGITDEDNAGYNDGVAILGDFNSDGVIDARDASDILTLYAQNSI